MLPLRDVHKVLCELQASATKSESELLMLLAVKAGVWWQCHHCVFIGARYERCGCGTLPVRGVASDYWEQRIGDE